jgi:hypothetical protein
MEKLIKINQMKNAVLGLLTFMVFISNGYATEYTKTSNKTFDVNKNVLLDIRTEFGEIKAYNWDKQKISVEATITVEADSQSKADERFERIKLQMDGGKDLVNIISSIESGFFGKAGNTIRIDFIIYYPSDCRLNLKTSFGSAFFETVNGYADISVDYGNFNVKNLLYTDNRIDIGFGKLNATQITNATVEVDYGSCQIEKIETLNLKTSFCGNVNIDNVNTLNIKSAYDKINIGNVTFINGSSQFTTLIIEEFEKKLILKTSYGSFKINSVASEFELIDVNSNFCSIKLGVLPSAHFSFYVDIDHGSFNYPKEKVLITNVQKDVTDLLMEGYFGSKEKAKGNIRLSVDHASANLFIK